MVENNLAVDGSTKRGRVASMLKGGISTTIVAMAICATAQASAQSTAPQVSQDAAPQSSFEDIVVTAQKRAQSVMDTPLSVTAFGANELATKQVKMLSDLSSVTPGVNIGQQMGVNRLFIRGIGLTSYASGADPSAAFYVDGVYVGRPTAQLASFFDVERVEILRGPQGALYGRNATAGAVNVITASPTRETSGYLNASLGNYALHEVDGAISGALSKDESLTARVAFHVLNHSGYGYDIAANHDVNDANQQSVRVTLQYKPNDRLDIKLIGEYHHEKDYNYYTIAFGAYPGYALSGLSNVPIINLNTGAQVGTIPAGIGAFNGQNAATNNLEKSNRRKGYAITLAAKYDLTDDITLSSTTGWRKFDRANNSDSDSTSADLASTFFVENSKQFSQDIQINFKNRSLDVVAGISYYHESLDNFCLVPFPQFSYGNDPSLPANKVNYIQSGHMPINAYAAFAQATYSVSNALRVTAGGRYSSEKRTSSGFFQGIGTPIVPLDNGKTWNGFTPKFGVEFDASSSTLLYASATKGFKSGTWVIGQDNRLAGQTEQNPVNPESIWAYEVGFKSRLLDRKLEITGAAFYYDYKDLQVQKIFNIGTITTNAASARIKGAEFSMRAQLTPELIVDGNVTYLDATFRSYDATNPLNPTGPVSDLSGNRLPGASKWAANAGISYFIPVVSSGSLMARVDANYASRIQFSEFNDPVFSQRGVTKINASVKYEAESGKWSVTAWGKNITDKYIKTNSNLGVLLWGPPVWGAVAPPATYGVTLGLKI